MKIVFAGTPEFAAKSLQALTATHHQIIAALTQPDRASGRGRKLTPSPVKALALEYDIPVYQPVTLKDQAAQELVKSFDADVMVVVAYGLILPKAIIDIPRYGCLNIHASLLPRWRGAAPIQRAIEAGDKQTGVSIMQMDEGLDTGDVLTKQAIDIAEGETAASLHDKLADLGAKLNVSTLKLLEDGTLKRERQDDSLATYAAKLARRESHIDWSQAVTTIVNRIHAFNPWPGAKAKHNGTDLKILKAKVINQTAADKVGEIRVEDKKIIVQTTDGQIQLLELQKPGGKPMSAGQFLNGYGFEKGDRFD